MQIRQSDSLFPDRDSRFDIEFQVRAFVFRRKQRVRNIGMHPVDSRRVELIITVDRHDHPPGLARFQHQAGHGQVRSGALRHRPPALVGHLEKQEALEFRPLSEQERPARIVAQRYAGVDRFVLHEGGAIERQVHGDLRRDGCGRNDHGKGRKQCFQHDSPFSGFRVRMHSSAMRPASSR
ncbi:hypothetical protein SDC9_177261 [bioreactor metagenome]|uniref:Uncharacterized protein n=1 Tax=bioreactor metagenome TaxID=1076179 RepID=A0A645GSI5_9ZZZZ